MIECIILGCSLSGSDFKTGLSANEWYKIDKKMKADQKQIFVFKSESQCQWSYLSWRVQKSLELFWWLSAQMSDSLCSKLVPQDFCYFESHLVSNSIIHFFVRFCKVQARICIWSWKLERNAFSLKKCRRAESDSSSVST